MYEDNPYADDPFFQLSDGEGDAAMKDGFLK